VADQSSVQRGQNLFASISAPKHFSLFSPKPVALSRGIRKKLSEYRSLPFSACPLPVLVRMVLRPVITLHDARVRGAGLVGECRDSNPAVPPRHHPDD
jgi:hypothetical protein